MRILIVLLAVACCACGCAPSRQDLVRERIRWAMSAVVASLDRDGDLFSEDQLVAMAGAPPDVKTTIPGFEDIARQVPGYTPDLVQATLERIYGGYRGRCRTESRDEDWRKADDFLRCKVWLYDWCSPSAIYACHPIPQATGLVSSRYFLLMEGKVVGVGGILRPAVK